MGDEKIDKLELPADRARALEANKIKAGLKRTIASDVKEAKARAVSNSRNIAKMWEAAANLEDQLRESNPKWNVYRGDLGEKGSRGNPAIILNTRRGKITSIVFIQDVEPKVIVRTSTGQKLEALISDTLFDEIETFLSQYFTS